MFAFRLLHLGRDKQPPYCRQHFQSNLNERKIVFHLDSTDFCSQWSNEQYASIASDDGVVSIRWQVIILTNDGAAFWHICARSQLVNIYPKFVIKGSIIVKLARVMAWYGPESHRYWPYRSVSGWYIEDCGMLSKCCVQTIGHFFQASMRYRFSNSRLNSLTPGWCGSKFKTVISKHVLWIKFMPFLWNCCRWTLQDLTDDQSTLFQVMAWCRQSPSHYLNQCWPSPMTPPVGSGTPAFRLGSRIDPHRHRGVVKVHWRVPWVGGLFS